MAFGPSVIGATDRLMGSADAVAGGFDLGSPTPWTSDLYLSSYGPCTTTYDPPDGVCPDEAFTLSNTSLSSLLANNVKLIDASSQGSVTFLHMTRPLAATNAIYDIPITPGKPQTFIWAHGVLTPGARPPAYRLSQHGIGPNDEGSLTLTLSTCQNTCSSLTPIATNSTVPASINGFTGPLALSGGGAVVIYWMLHDKVREIELSLGPEPQKG